MKTRTQTLTLAALALAVVSACVRDFGSGSAEPEPDVVGELIEMALEAHEAATGKTRPERISLVSWGELDLEEMPPEIAEEARRRIESGSGLPAASPDSGQPATGWTVHFDVTPAEPGIVYVGVREAEATAWPLYGISVTRTPAGLRVGEVVGVGRAIT